MDTFNRFTLHLALVTAILTGTSAMSTFRSRIPNGWQVPHPCGPAYVWRGVGHESYLGGGARNPFGLAFKANNLEWTQALCETDSDGDGRTNGEELGDPGCTWVLGAEPNRTTILSHPGVCEPLDSATCQDQNDFVNCEDLCDNVREEGVSRQTVALDPPVALPVNQIVHKCLVFDFPQDGDYHMTAAAPHISDFSSLKHITVFGCAGDSYPEPPGSVYDCYMNTQCPIILFHWTMGDDDVCFHPDTGFRVGNNVNMGAFTRGLLEVHLHSPDSVERQDASGISLFYTAGGRPHDAGIFFFGQSNLNIPPGSRDHVVRGGCSGACTGRIITDTVNVTAAFNHMHYKGTKAVSQWIEQRRRVHYIAYDETFSYDSPKYHSLAEPVQLHPGAGLNMECHYDTTDRNVTTHAGFDTYKDEMCYGYLMYYPKENIQTPFCQSFSDLDSCDLENKDNVKGCNLTKMDFRDPDEVPYFNDVQSSCRAGVCLHECMSLLAAVRRHPCYTRSMREYLLTTWGTTGGSTVPEVDFLSFWLKMASCDAEIAVLDMVYDDTSGGGSVASRGWSVAAGLVLMLAAATIN